RARANRCFQRHPANSYFLIGITINKDTEGTKRKLADSGLMADRSRNILICSCEGTMSLDETVLRRGCRDAKLTTSNHLCRAEVDRFRAAVAAGEPITVGCTQEAPLFSEVAGEQGKAPALTFVNLREMAGWSDQSAAAGPKMAGLIAAAQEPVPD